MQIQTSQSMYCIRDKQTRGGTHVHIHTQACSYGNDTIDVCWPTETCRAGSQNRHGSRAHAQSMSTLLLRKQRVSDLEWVIFFILVLFKKYFYK
jgi:hypothetical protein